MAKKKVSKAVAVKEEKSVLVEGTLSGSLANIANFDTSVLGDVELDVADDMEIFKNDIVIPKIHLIQSMSELRKEKRADEGDYVDSRTGKILLGEDEEAEHLPIVVMKTFKRWQTFQTTENGKPLERKKFLSSQIMTISNANLDYEGVLDGEEFKRRQVISAYVLLGKDAQAGIVKPYIVDFYGFSKEGGRALVSDIKVLNSPKKNPRTGELIRKGLPSWIAWFKLGQYETKKNDDVFNVKSVEFGGELPQEMWGFLKDANEEIKALMQNDAVEIDDSDLMEGAKSETEDANVVANATATDASL